METEIHLALAKRADLTAAMRAQIFDSGYLYVASAIRHSELETSDGTTLQGETDTAAVPMDIWFPEIVYNTTDEQRITPAELDTIESRTKPAGNPSKYVRWGSSFRFDKKPAEDKTITIFYTRKPAILEAGENSVMDHLYDQLIVMFTIKFAMEELRDFDQAAKMQTAINVYAGQIKVPWRMTRLDHRAAGIRVQMR